MINESFDINGKELISAKDVIKDETAMIGKQAGIETMILTFSYKLIDILKEKEIIEEINEELKLGSAAGYSLVYRIKNTDIGVMLTGIGAPLAGAMIEELKALMDIKNVVIFGSCGVLEDIPEGRIIIPDEAYRDEGMSYHYAPASDYIKIKNADRIAKIFEKENIDYVRGKTWTTDAFYRETDTNRDKRLKEGCICVEMECAALQAVCDFRNVELYQFVYSADSLKGNWSRRILGSMEKDVRLAYFFVALKIAESL